MLRRDLGRHVNARLRFYGSTGFELLARLALALRTVRKPFHSDEAFELRYSPREGEGPLSGKHLMSASGASWTKCSL
jgi:hypothetical protein